MQKKIKYFWIVVLIFISTITHNLKIDAANASLSISGNSSVVIGDTIQVNVNLSYSEDVTWEFGFSYDSNYLTLVSASSGCTDASKKCMIAQSKSANVSFVFKANKLGSTTFTITSGNLSDIVITGERLNISARSKSISITNPPAPTNPTTPSNPSTPTTPNTPNTPATSLSSVAELSSLTLSVGELSPEFSFDVTKYSVNLAEFPETFTINGTASHPKATVEGLGNIALKEGQNTVVIRVKAEDGNYKEYEIVINVPEQVLPTHIFETDDGKKEFGMMNNFTEVIDYKFLEGFEVKETEINKQKVNVLEKNEIKFLYLKNAEGDNLLYRYLPDQNFVYPAQFISINTTDYLIGFIPQELRKLDAFNYGSFILDDEEIFGVLLYNDETMNDIVYLRLVNQESEEDYYLYSLSSKDLIKIPDGAILYSKTAFDELLAKGKNMMPFYGIIGGLIFILILATFFFFNKIKNYKNIINRKSKREMDNKIEANISEIKNDLTDSDKTFYEHDLDDDCLEK